MRCKNGAEKHIVLVRLVCTQTTLVCTQTTLFHVHARKATHHARMIAHTHAHVRTRAHPHTHKTAQSPGADFTNHSKNHPKTVRHGRIFHDAGQFLGVSLFPLPLPLPLPHIYTHVCMYVCVYCVYLCMYIPNLFLMCVPNIFLMCVPNVFLYIYIYQMIKALISINQDYYPERY
jgi:hypothetical protein